MAKLTPTSFHPLTALCAALALWALAVFGLSLFGLGAGFGPRPDDPSLAPELPVLQMSQRDSRLGPATDYLEVGQRPLLMPDRRPGAFTDSGEGDASAPLEAVLTGVIISGDVRLATLQDSASGASRRVRQGELLEGSSWRLQSVEPRRAVFFGPAGEKVLELRVFDGKGGVAPTPAGVPPTTDSAAAAPAPAKPEPVASAEPPAAAAESTDQQAQVEAIRRRIEARRAQMRAEAAKNAADKED